MATFDEFHGEPGLDASDEPFLCHGEELTEERAEQLAQETLANLGRPNLIPDGKSMSGGWQHAPVMRPRETMRDDAAGAVKAELVVSSALAPARQPRIPRSWAREGGRAGLVSQIRNATPFAIGFRAF